MEDSIKTSRPADEPLLEAAVRYTEEWHWDVHPGTWLVDAKPGAIPQCSCGDRDCPRPGAHPTLVDWVNHATGAASTVRRMWTESPRASILIPTGRSFDVLDVPEVAGCLALARMERMDIRLGPVCSTADRRLQFLVLPGVSSKIPEMLRRIGWVAESLDLVCRGDGDHIVAPPSRTGTNGSALWARQPTLANRWLPEAEELLHPLAYACGREAAAARGR